ncbi:MAG: hypothetical protein KJ964_00725 [Verrucomicrobia bacterium]|nr:hypothetical protein [Verrucomicrobiota bacterium]MBU1735042.1 hypothetical protein [Verrucomicrobiota bacterium]MBU1856677.1 hypothetical protein [Verrucomicrobiota bacterium]
MKNLAAIFLILAALLGLWGAARLHEQLWDYRARHQLLPAAPLENAPPLMAFTTVALGGFRGLIADLLWLRIIRLQQEGRIFEIAQLADWITKLEPHFTTVWAFQAWNMAYNISVLFPDAENRWRWVNNGIRLLRDEGLRYNPRNPNLYKELGWLYQHKIGYIMDSAHPFYRRKLAETMQAVLHGARLENHPEDTDLQRLREELKLDPAFMRQLDAEYGPFDWRLPETHALYWAWLGRQATPGTPGVPGTPDTPGVRSCDQMMLQCLSAAFRQGRLDFDPATDLYVTTPRLDLLPQVMKTYEEVIARYNERFFREIYANFLGEAIIILHSYGRVSQAREIYQQVLRRYPDVDRTISYDDFISANFAAMQKNAGDLPPPDAVAIVEGLLFQACRRKAAGDLADATEDERRARAFRDIYMQARASEDHRLRTGLPELDMLRRQAERRAQEETNAVIPERTAR